MRTNKKNEKIFTRDDLSIWLLKNVSSIRSKTESDLLTKEMILFFQNNISKNTVIEIKGLGVFKVHYFKEREGKVPTISYEQDKNDKSNINVLKKVIRLKKITKKSFYKILFTESNTLKNILNNHE